MKKLLLLTLFPVVVLATFLLISKISPLIGKNQTISNKINHSTGSSSLFLKQAKNMTLEEKLRQVLVCSYEGMDAQNALNQTNFCGNFILFEENLSGLTQEEIKKNNGIIHQSDPLAWIMIDQEGGRVARIKNSSTSARKIGDTDTATYWGNLHGELLKGLDIDVNLAPVADISKQSPAIGDRSFSDDPNDVGNYVVQYLQALQEKSVIAVVKHLPGHGRVLSDTHSDLGYLRYSWNEIANFDLIPFIKAVDGGAKIIMVGHIIVPDLDTKPATISQNTISQLRKSLPHGSDIILITDSLSMAGVGIPPIESVVEALKAGQDLLLIQEKPDSISKIHKALIDAYISGYLDGDKLNLSVAKILQLKSQYGKRLPTPTN